MSDTEETDVTTSVLTGFLFGNIDQSGKLENDFLDQVKIKKIHLFNITSFKIIE